MKNTGVIIKKPKPTDYRVGGETGITFQEVNPSGDWTEFLPTNEYQFGNFDTMACVTFSATNCIETQVNFMVANNLIPQDKLQLLKDWGFFDEEDKFNCSDRFTAKVSGTTNKGNTLTNVWDSIRKDGLVPEDMWEFPRGSFTWDNYYDKIPSEVKDFAKNILDIFEFKYEWVYLSQCGNPLLSLMSQSLKQAPLHIVTPVCPTWKSGNVIPCGTCRTDHATMVYGISDAIKDFDHYEPFKKRLAVTYTIPYCLKGVVSLKKPVVIPDVLHYQFLSDLKYGQKNVEVNKLQRALKFLGFFPAEMEETFYYGEWTRQAVRKFQFAYNVASLLELLCVNGKIVGPKTRAKLNEIFK